MATIKEQTEKTERLKTSLDNKVDSIGSIINTKIKEKPTTLTQVEDVLNRKMLGIGDMLPFGTWELDDEFSMHWTKLNTVYGSYNEPGICKNDTHIFVRNVAKNIDKLDLDGNVLKTFNIQDNYYRPLIADNSFVYAVENTNLTAIDVNTGDRIWTVNSGFDIDKLAQNSTHIFIGNLKGVITAYTKADGNKAWTKTVMGGIKFACLYADDNYLLWSLQNNGEGCLNASTGANIWKKSIGERATSFAIRGDEAYCTNYDSKIYCFKIKTGDIIWESKAYATSGPAVYPTNNILLDAFNNIYFVFDYKTIYKLAPTGKAEIYSITDLAEITDIMLMRDEKDLIVSTADKKLIRRNNPSMCPIITNIIDSIFA